METETKGVAKLLPYSIHYSRDFHWLNQSHVRAATQVGLDIETEVYEHPDGRRAGLSPHNGNIACIQICVGDEVYITHWGSGTLDDVPGAFLLREMLESEFVQKVIHNAIFEHQFLMHELPGLVMRNVWDTQVGEYVLAAGRNHGEDGYTLEGGRQKLSLGDTVKRRFQHEMDKGDDVRLSFMRGPALTDRQLKYAAEDAFYCLLVAEQQLDAMDEDTRRVMKLDCEVTEAVARMMLNGFPAERDLFQALVNEWTQRVDELYEFLSVTLYMPGDGEQLLSATGRPRVSKGQPVLQTIDLHSAPKMLERLAACGIEVENYQRAELKNHIDRPEVAALLEWKALTKLVGTYVDKLPDHVHPVTGRIHCDYRITSTATGRASVEKPGLQQIPSRTKEGRRIRDCFKAPAGKKLVIADYANIELRLIAELFEEDNMIRAFAEGIDLHHLTGAAVMYDVRDPDWDSLMPIYREFKQRYDAGEAVVKKARQDAKALNFGLAYGAGAQKLQELAWRDYDLEWSIEEATMKRNLWLSLYPGIRTYHRKMGVRLNHTGPYGLLVSTVEGRNRFVKGYSEALNHPIQGTSADMTKRAMIALCRDVELVLAVHDEIIALADEDDADWVADLVKACMVAAGEHYMKQVACEVDVHIEDTWRK